MSSESLIDFTNHINSLILSEFPSSNIDSNMEYLPLQNSFEKAIFSWAKIKSEIKVKYWKDYYKDYPNKFNSDHMALFLYRLAREEAQAGRIESADRIAYLNKIRNGLDVWHTVALPVKTLFVHPIGTVLGRAKYGSSLICYQNVTVGDSKGNYPEFLGSCLLYSNVSVLGKSKIGSNVVIGAGTLVIDKAIPNNSIVYGQGKNLTIKPNPTNLFDDYFHLPFEKFLGTKI